MLLLYKPTDRDWNPPWSTLSPALLVNGVHDALVPKALRGMGARLPHIGVILREVAWRSQSMFVFCATAAEETRRPKTASARIRFMIAAPLIGVELPTAH